MSRPSSAQSFQSDLGSLMSKWALQVNEEIPRASKVDWETKPSQETLEGIFRSSSNKHLRASDRTKSAAEDESQEIPELEAEDEPVPEVKVPPKARFPTKKELDMNLLPNHDPEIDLRPLISALLPMAQVIEEDTLWDPSSLLAEVIARFDQASCRDIHYEVLIKDRNGVEEVIDTRGR